MVVSAFCIPPPVEQGLVRQITRLVIQERDKERVNVHLDGEFAFGLALNEAIHLKVGQLLSDADIEALQQEDAYHKAYHRVLDLLSRRPYSTGEVQRYLEQKKVAPTHSEQVITRLTEVGLLDDLAFARFWIENRDAFQPRSAMAIRYELRQKGLDAETIDQALDEGDFDEEEAAYRAGLKALSRLRKFEDKREFIQKLAGVLGRRGFRWEVIRRAGERLWEIKDDNTLP
jgi:regulatory protein